MIALIVPTVKLFPLLIIVSLLHNFTMSGTIAALRGKYYASGGDMSKTIFKVF